jgi:hypothetical protein
MKFDSVTGVKDRWYDNVLVMDYEPLTHQCILISRDGLHTCTVSRSSIISTDAQIALCVEEINAILLHDTYDKLRVAVDDAVAHNRFLDYSRVGVGIRHANTNE